MRYEVTAIGWVVIPATLLYALLAPRLLAPWAVFLSVFQGSAAFNIARGGTWYGLQPVFIAAPLAVAYWLLTSRRQARAPVHRVCWPVYAFAAYSAFTSLFFPRLFEGRALVDSPRAGVGVVVLTPLRPSFSNLSWPAYLIVCLLLMIVVACETQRDPRYARRVMNFLLLGLTVAALVGIYQVFAYAHGWPYPGWVFNSNRGYSQMVTSGVAGLRRLSSTFSESSIASYFLGGGLAYVVWRIVFERATVPRLVVGGLLLSALLFTTSTTAYIMVVFTALLLALRVLFSMRRMPPRVILTIFSGVLITFAGVFWLSQHMEVTTRILSTAIFQKDRSLSYFQRARSNQIAWLNFQQSFGLGVGLGSIRASSMIVTLLGSVGWFGLLLLTWFAAKILAAHWRLRRYDRAGFQMREALLAGILAMLCAATLAVPDLDLLPFWALIGVFVGLAVRPRPATPVTRGMIGAAAEPAPVLWK